MKQDMLRVAGFPEWLPLEQGVENKMKEIVSKEYQKYGYINIETPAVEKNDVLTSKSWEEVSKQIFWLYGLAQKKEDLKEYSLHFDLTVPLARYIIDHEEKLEFPFKRYQIQKVWRGERQQKWRFKEFYQCDVDVIDKNVNIAYDAEVIDVLYKTLSKMFAHFNIHNDFIVQINNRKLYDAVREYMKIDNGKKMDVIRLFDDYYRMEKKEFEDMLKELVGEDYKTIIDLLSFDIDTIDIMTIEDEKIRKAVDEIKYVYDSLKQRGVNIKFDPYVIRWLDYYSGTVFETFIDGYRNLGSVCSGGRFDNLVGYIRNKTGKQWNEYGGVGGSIGLSRLLNGLLDSWLLQTKETLSDVIVFSLNDTSEKYREEIATTLRNNDYRVDQYLKPEKIAKQFKYAESKNIPFGIFAWEKEEVNWTVTIKDLYKKESVEIKKEKISEFMEYNKKKND